VGNIGINRMDNSTLSSTLLHISSSVHLCAIISKHLRSYLWTRICCDQNSL